MPRLAPLLAALAAAGVARLVAAQNVEIDQTFATLMNVAVFPVCRGGGEGVGGGRGGLPF